MLSQSVEWRVLIFCNSPVVFSFLWTLWSVAKCGTCELPSFASALRYKQGPVFLVRVFENLGQCFGRGPFALLCILFLIVFHIMPCFLSLLADSFLYFSYLENRGHRPGLTCLCIICSEQLAPKSLFWKQTNCFLQTLQTLLFGLLCRLCLAFCLHSLSNSNCKRIHALTT